MITYSSSKLRRGSAGLTLVEVMIGMAILGIVLLMSYGILFSVTTTSARGNLTSQLEDRGKQVLQYCKHEFYDARFRDPTNGAVITLGIHDNHCQIHYQVALQQNSSGSVDYGYVGRSLIIDPLTKKPDYVASKCIGQSAVLRFEPELAVYEANFVTTTVLQPATTDATSPSVWKPNPYMGVALTPGQALPTKIMNRDMNRDGDKIDVFVKGKIWKYIMDDGSSGGPYSGFKIVDVERVADDVYLALGPGGKFEGDLDVPTPVGQPVGKDWLFRYLISEPFPSTTYGNTDVLWLGDFPSATSVAIAVTVWTGSEDASGKDWYFRKAWERIPFRLSNK